MTQTSRVIHGSRESIRVRLGESDLRGDAADLGATVVAVVGSSNHSRVILDAGKSHDASAEAIAALLRLRTQLRSADVDLLIEPIHPTLEAKLRRLGILRVLAEG